MVGKANAVELSVIVACQHGGPTLEKSLATLSSQTCSGTREVIVVDAADVAGPCIQINEFPSVQFLKLPAGTSVPKLWSAGIGASQGRIIALTIEECIPDADWLEQILRAHDSCVPAIGGVIEANPHLGLVDWAIYFCRYSGYMPPLDTQFLDDLPGDNCSYKRAALEPLLPQMTDGFWETFVHRSMRLRGDLLQLAPAIRVFYAGTIPWAFFMKGRFSQGRYFAAQRARSLTVWRRFGRAIVAPAIPALLLRRIAVRVWKRQHRSRFLQSLPLLMLFLAAWSMGECTGYLLGVPTEYSRSAQKERKAWEQAG